MSIAVKVIRKVCALPFVAALIVLYGAITVVGWLMMQIQGGDL